MALPRRGYPALVIIDYAEGRHRLKAWLNRLLEADRARSKIRIVLLARHAEDWWTCLAQGDAAVEHLLREPAVRLRDLSYGAGDRLRLYQSALSAYSEKLELKTPNSASLTLSDARYARPLYVHMAALFRVLEPSSELAQDAAQLPLKIVERESARMWGLPGLTSWPIKRVMAAVTLLGGVELAELANVAANAAWPIDEALVRQLMAYYPRDNGVGALEPDLLGEALVYQVLREKLTSRDYLEQVLAKASSRQLQKALILLARIGAEHPAEARSWIDRILGSEALDRARPAFDAALAVAEQDVDDVLGRALAALLQSQDDAELAREWAQRLPRRTIALLDVRVWVYKQLKASAESRAERARVGLILGTCLQDVGDLNGAFRATQEAVRTYRELASQLPGDFLRDLAGGLNNLGTVLSALGKLQEARGMADEAVDIQRKLVVRLGDALFPDLAMSLNNLVVRRSEVGDTDGALAAARECVGLCRELPRHLGDVRGPVDLKQRPQLRSAIHATTSWGSRPAHCGPVIARRLCTIARLYGLHRTAHPGWHPSANA